MRPALFAVLFSTTACSLASVQVPTWGQNETVESQRVPIETVQRLLESEFVDVQRILVNELPDDLPIQIPLPEQTTVLASVVLQGQGLDHNFYRIVAEVPRPADDLIIQYQEQLATLGWKVRPEVTSSYTNGFIESSELPNNQLDNSLVMCSEDGNQILTTSIRSQEATFSSLDLLLYTAEEDSSCLPAPLSSRPLVEGLPIPVLNPPAETNVSLGATTSSGSSGTVLAASFSAAIESNLSAEAIAQHYATQWESSRWMLLSTEASNGIMQSVWILEEATGESWQGTFKIEPSVDEPGTYIAGATVENLSDAAEN